MHPITHLIDEALQKMSRNDFAMMVPGEIPPAMLDHIIKPDADWRGWKPIDSIITDEDIQRFEAKIGLGLPASYKAFLKHKHFFHLYLPDGAVNLFEHLPDHDLKALEYQVFQCHEPEFIIGRKYIYFADFHDYGLLCFDANEPAPDNEYKIVWLDHEDLEPVIPYSSGFQELLEADSERGNDFITQLNQANTRGEEA